ncbi:MAG: 3,4-dihydroxy-2-butanone-4-phosphate synthase [Candidatus Peribacteraceae bacterium]|jgi:3,4-dihydroxy 2-butanone 4-phosphate synthase/GTP cyclohydrolase II|nr:3,4-dihydroxy-2-butanone-4-phosphate synthase [Candidatus Peribacteraceae bacterium]MDP7454368.1 3,4-dihydroxy-2-butanone-4-phosphate synthase [Candidatus Peribacteraceae bacterium]MDP7645586.1 3,4-dihydroxy-2-butanone-4-phosphate synthase [Candidatus Peribacteraceae bacterium]HJO61844.1 3,4-dihydroxy-2-butanone-4-phosphate synthase [Desulfobacterales bacterium]|tara:strand:+ start:1284 stop:2495 length:1212 start_codon:yes stop_codon:yes gene_type:complete
MSNISSISDSIKALQEGGMVVVIDDEDRENEGDLVIAAEHITEEKMAFIIRHTGGVVCLSLSNEIADRLDFPPMVKCNTARLKTQFTVSVDARDGISTGISAKDRTVTIKKSVDPLSLPNDFVRPGHIFPLRSSNGGVLVRAGHTEACVDLCKLAVLKQAAVLSELMNDDGTMMRLSDLEKFASENEIPIITIADLIEHRRNNEVQVKLEATSDLETDKGIWKIHVFNDTLCNKEHVALVKGEINPKESIMVRVHSECLTGDTFLSCHCDCGNQLRIAMDKINDEGTGIILYMRQEGRGIGLANKVRAYALQQEEGMDTVEANEKLGFDGDLRDYGIGAQILKLLKVRKLKLLTNNPKKIIGLQGHDLIVTERVPIESQKLSDRQKKYLQVKKSKMKHMLKSV